MSLAQRSALVMSGALIGLGLLFSAAPRAGVVLFGLPATRSDALDYARALGFRDLSVAAALAGSAALGRRPLAVTAAASAIIPFMDMALVARRRGREATPQLGLHGTSALALIAIAALSLAPSRG
jgi:hypothetical protein